MTVANLANEPMRRWATLLSPILVIAVGMGTQHAVGRHLGAWSWAPTIVAFWCCIAGVIAWTRQHRPIRSWFAHPRGGWMWSLIAVGVGLVSAQEFMSGWRTLLSSSVLVSWLVVGLVNPWFEESYWRGALIDATGRWKLLGVVYSAATFALSHPLIWGVHSVALRRPAGMVGLAVAGTVWGVTYWRTGSLRWVIVGHACADLLGLSVPVLLNLYLPAWAR
jgi:uncharacterized protein